MILEVKDLGALLATFHVRPLLVDQILVGQSQDPQMIKLKEEIEKGKKAEFQIRDDGIVTPQLGIWCQVRGHFFFFFL